jgi:hypothetical protein
MGLGTPAAATSLGYVPESEVFRKRPKRNQLGAARTESNEEIPRFLRMESPRISMGVVNQPVEDAVSQCGITDLLIPARDRPSRSPHPPAAPPCGRQPARRCRCWFSGHVRVNIESTAMGQFHSPAVISPRTGLHGGEGRCLFHRPILPRSLA